MANLEELAWTVRNDGYSEVNAEAKVCQDVVLKAISNTSLSRNVTIKGGVVMRSITGDTRHGLGFHPILSFQRSNPHFHRKTELFVRNNDSY